MDPDLDPNLQHWQDRLDSLQWVIGSILSSNIDSVLDLTETADRAPRRLKTGAHQIRLFASSSWRCWLSTGSCPL